MMDDQDSTALLDVLIREHARLKQALQARNTRNGYKHDWRDFVAFCGRIGAPSLPATQATVGLYITDTVITRGLKASTAARRVSAVADMHKSNGHPSPATAEVRILVRAAKRLRVDGIRQVRPLSIDHLRQISLVLAVKDRSIDIRNRAICVLGFATALRSDNLASLQMSDIEFCDRGLVVTVRKEKTNQEGNGGRLIGVPHGKHRETDGVACLKDWIARRGSSPGPLFSRLNHKNEKLAMQPERFCQIVQQCVATINLDPAEHGSHSLRAGLVTEGGLANVGEMLLANQTGHRDTATLRKYFRHRDIWRSNPLELLDL